MGGITISWHYNNEINRFCAILVSQKHPDSVSINLICSDRKVGASIFLGAFFLYGENVQFKELCYT